MNWNKFDSEKIILPRRAYMFLVRGTVSTFLGMSLNFLVIKNNRGKVPVLSPFSFETSTHFSIENVSEINYLAFSDIFCSKWACLSLGDFFLFLGGTFLILSFFMFILNVMSRVKSREVIS